MKLYKNNKIDWHVHTRMSDSSDPLPKVIERARRCDLEKIIITDHHSFLDPQSVRKEAGNKIKVGQGVELWTRFKNQDIHMLGYGLDINDSNLRIALQPALDEENRISEEIIKECQKRGSNLPFAEEIMTDSYKGSLKTEKAYIDRKDVATAIHHTDGLCFKEALKMINKEKYGGTDSLFSNIRSDFKHMSPIQAIQIIHDAKGKAVIAHPGFIFHNSPNSEEQDWKILLELFTSCIEHGLDGAEVVSLWHKRQFSYNFLKDLLTISENKKINFYKRSLFNKISSLKLLTRGSDDHGDYKKNFSMELLTKY